MDQSRICLGLSTTMGCCYSSWTVDCRRVRRLRILSTRIWTFQRTRDSNSCQCESPHGAHVLKDFMVLWEQRYRDAIIISRLALAFFIPLLSCSFSVISLLWPRLPRANKEHVVHGVTHYAILHGEPRQKGKREIMNTKQIKNERGRERDREHTLVMCSELFFFFTASTMTAVHASIWTASSSTHILLRCMKIHFLLLLLPVLSFFTQSKTWPFFCLSKIQPQRPQ